MLQDLHSYFSHCHDQMPAKQQLQEGSRGDSQFEETESILAQEVKDMVVEVQGSCLSTSL